MRTGARCEGFRGKDKAQVSKLLLIIQSILPSSSRSRYSALDMSFLFRFLPIALAYALGSTHADSIPDDVTGKRKVVHIVLDGLTARALDSLLADNRLPILAYIKSKGVFTDNARIDYDSSQTLPSHISMFTGLTVEQHGFKEDKDPGTSKAINGLNNIFDLVSDAKLGRTCLFAAKDKFNFFKRSTWNIDHYDYNKDGEDTVSAFKAEMEGDDPCVYSFVHFRQPDKTGHADGPDDKEYRQAVQDADEFVGDVLDILANGNMMDNTAVIVATDHGFEVDGNHSDKTDKNVYTVPFFVMGPHVEAGSNLYEMNLESYADPGNTRPNNDATKQPIRTRHSGVLAADFLGVGANVGPLATSNQLLNVNSGESSDSPTKTPTAAPPSSDTPTTVPTVMPTQAPTTPLSPAVPTVITEAPTAAPSTVVPTVTTGAPTPTPQIPSIQSFEAIGMTYINEKRKAKAYGSRRMILNIINRFRKARQGLLRFDLSAGRIDEIAKIEVALACTKGSGNGVSFFKTIESNWDQNTVTWEAAPGKDYKIGSISGLQTGETYTTTLIGGKRLVDENGILSILVTTRSRKNSLFDNGKLIVTYSEPL